MHTGRDLNCETLRQIKEGKKVGMQADRQRVRQKDGVQTG